MVCASGAAGKARVGKPERSRSARSARHLSLWSGQAFFWHSPEQYRAILHLEHAISFPPLPQ